jgi:uncharacterized membrane protein
MQNRYWELFGKMHVVIVHFPIALLIVAAALESVRMVLRRSFSPAACVCLYLGTIATVVAVGMGWVDARFNAFSGDQGKILAWHRWMGVAVAIISVALAIFAATTSSKGRTLFAYRAALLICAGLVGLAGHYGGMLVHGSDFLTLAPADSENGTDANTTVLAIAHTGPSVFPADGKIDYFRDVQPILAENCYSCHSYKVKRGNLRLDGQKLAMNGGNSGPSIIANDPDHSLLIRRVMGLDDKAAMPLDAKPLNDVQKKILRAWIAQGAIWPQGKGNEPLPDQKHWAYVAPVRPIVPSGNDQDHWVRNPIDAFVLAKLQQSNLKPSPPAPKAILLRRVCLDLTGLPPTPEEADEYMADSSPDAYEHLVDRLLASPHYGERWAHHWLDLARYADSNGYEKDSARSIWPYRDWVIKAFNDDMPFDRFTIEQLAGDLLPNATLDDRVATGFQRNTMINQEGGIDTEEYRYYAEVDRVNTTASTWLASTVNCCQCHDHKFDPFLQKDYYSLLAFYNSTAPESEKDSGSNPRDISPCVELPNPKRDQVLAQIADLKKQLVATTPTLESDQQKWEQQLDIAATQPALATELKIAKVPATVKAVHKIPTTQRSTEQSAHIATYYRTIAPALQPIRDQIADLQKQADAMKITSLVMQEMSTPRPTHIHIRGAFLTEGDLVQPDTPGVLNPFSPSLQRNRLGLAEWLVDPANPLTARVTVNRIWEQYFGRGIVGTSEDFGTRGDLPTHPELLDWLATEFIRDKWSIKAIHRLIVTSATYQQQSSVSTQLVESDPYNKLLARGPRVRLDAEAIRDQSLVASNLLSPKIGGPSVFPYQPDGVWNVVYNGATWKTSTGGDQYRRGIYTFWRRSAPYPSFATFDATSREVTCTRRSRTDTPLQAMTSLNDPAFVQPAAALARLIVKDGGTSPGDKIIYGFRRVLVRLPSDQEMGRLISLYKQMIDSYKQDPTAAAQLADGGLSEPLPKSADKAELAAWTAVSNVLLNLDETLTKE